jgi:anti-repressor protein
MNELIQFDFKGNPINVILHLDGEPWFIADEVCEILELSNTSQSVGRLDDDEKLIYTLYMSGQNREVLLINESGLYSLIMTSRKPKAKEFKKWVTAEVLPSIRKTGSYSINKQPDMRVALSDPATLRSMLLSFTEEVIFLKAMIQEQAPKVEFYDAATEAVNCQTVQQTAKTLNIGPNKLFEFLRKERILMNNNLPYQQFIDAKHFCVVNKPYTDRRGEQRISTRTLVTGRGLVLIQKRLVSAIGRARLRKIPQCFSLKCSLYQAWA